MQVQSRTNNYNQAPRSAGLDRRQPEAESDDAATLSRRDDAITGSRAVLSSSLADALWAIQRSSAVEDNASTSSVEAIYRAYAF